MRNTDLDGNVLSLVVLTEDQVKAFYFIYKDVIQQNLLLTYYQLCFVNNKYVSLINLQFSSQARKPE
jgi:hypothetical protein